MKIPSLSFLTLCAFAPLRETNSYFHSAKPERLQFLAVIMQNSTVIEVNELVTDCRDPKDNKFLELAISGNASCIISGDDDLLSLHPFRGIAIVTPQVFVKQF